jgi:hypothetical protein
MRKLVRKIPLLIWAIFLSILAYFIVTRNLIENITDAQIKLLSGFLTFIGLIFVAINIQRQWKNERIKTEYLNQPDFQFSLFGKKEFRGSAPVLCPNSTECTEDHWVDIIQTGNLSANNLKVALFHKSESKTDVRNSNRWLTEKRLSKGDEFQYKLPQFKIPLTLLDNQNSNCFHLLLEYNSEYSGIKYKRVYQMCAIPTKTTENIKENDWKNRIYFYEKSLILTTDSDSITIKNILINKWLKLSIWLKLKKDYSYDEWLLDI